MSLPDQSRVLAALDVTWPAAMLVSDGPWTLRKGLGGGQRVSAATANGPILESDIASAEAGMRKLRQHPLFMIRPNDAYDAWLAARDYDIVDPVTLYAVESEALTGLLPVTAAIPSWPPLAIQAELWAQGGISAQRVAVMERANAPKVSILGRSKDTPSGTVFVAADNDVAMLHALEVSREQRRKGIGSTLITAASNWAKQANAKWLTLAVTSANEPANSLYRRAGMTVVGNYHYRRAPEGPT